MIREYKRSDDAYRRGIKDVPYRSAKQRKTNMPKKLSKKDKQSAARRMVEKKAATKKSGGKKNMFSNAASGSY